jgi:hypothetical protein
LQAGIHRKPSVKVAAECSKRVAGYPESFAQEALGHNSKAVHRANVKRMLVKIPSLAECERKAAGQDCFGSA